MNRTIFFVVLSSLFLLPSSLFPQYSTKEFERAKATDLYDERGYSQAGAISVDGSLTVGNSNGNLSYVYPLAATSISGFLFDVTLNYVNSVRFVAYKDYASGNYWEPYARWNRFSQNRPAWIISCCGFAVQMLSSNGMFHCDPARFNNPAQTQFDDRDMVWLAEGYDVCNRAEDIITVSNEASHGYQDVIRLLRGDGSVLKLYNKKSYDPNNAAENRADLYSGYYVSAGANASDVALVSFDTSAWNGAARAFVESEVLQTYPYIPRVVRYYPGNGQEFVFRENTISYGMRAYRGAELQVPNAYGAMRAQPSIFYLEEINSTAGPIVSLKRSRHYAGMRENITLNGGNIFDPVLNLTADSTVGRALTTDIGDVHIGYGATGMVVEAFGRTTKIRFDSIRTSGNAQPEANWMPLASRGYFTETAQRLAWMNEHGVASQPLYEGYMGYVTEILDPEGRRTSFEYEPYTRTYVNYGFPKEKQPGNNDIRLTLTNQRLKHITEPAAQYAISYTRGDIMGSGEGMREDNVRAAEIRADVTNNDYPFLETNVASLVRKYDHDGTPLTEAKYTFLYDADDGFWKGIVNTKDNATNAERVSTYEYRPHVMPDSIRIKWEPGPRFTELYQASETAAGVSTVKTVDYQQSAASPYVWLPSAEEVMVNGIRKGKSTFSYTLDTVRTYGGDTRLARLFGLEVKRSITRTLDPVTEGTLLADTSDFIHLPLVATTLPRLDTLLNKFATLDNYFRLRDSGLIVGPWERWMYDPRVAVFSFDSTYEHAYVPPRFSLLKRQVVADGNGTILGGRENYYTLPPAMPRYVNDLWFLGTLERDSVISRGGTSKRLGAAHVYRRATGVHVPMIDTNANGAAHRLYYSSYGSQKLRTPLGVYEPRARILHNDGTVTDTVLPHNGYFSTLFNKPLSDEVYVRKFDPFADTLKTDTMIALNQYTYYGQVSGTADYNGNYIAASFDRNGRVRSMWAPGDFARRDAADTVRYRDVARFGIIGTSERQYTVDTMHCDSGRIYAGPWQADYPMNFYAGHPATMLPECPCPPQQAATREKDEGRKDGRRSALENCNVHRPFPNNIYVYGNVHYLVDSASPLLNIEAIDSAYLELHTMAVTGECVTVTVKAYISGNGVRGPEIMNRSYLLNCPNSGDKEDGGARTREKDKGRGVQRAGDGGAGTTLKVNLHAIEHDLMGLRPMQKLEFELSVPTPGSGVEFVSGMDGEDTRPALVVGGVFARPNDLADYTLAYTYDDRALTSTVQAKLDGIGHTANRIDPARYNGATTRRTSASHRYGADGRVFASVTPIMNGLDVVRHDSVAHAYTGGGARLHSADPEGDIVQTAYDALGRPVEVTNADGTKGRVAYYQGSPATFGLSGNFYGFVSATVAADENGVKHVRYTDAFGRLRREVADSGDAIHLNLTTRYEYDTQGRLSYVVNPEGDTTNYWYDVWGNVREKGQPDLGSVTYSYDKMGNVRYAQNQDQWYKSKLTFNQYDDLNRLTLVGEAIIGESAHRAPVEDDGWDDPASWLHGHVRTSDGIFGTQEKKNTRRSTQGVPTYRLTDQLDATRLAIGTRSAATPVTANPTIWKVPAMPVPTFWTPGQSFKSFCTLNPEPMLQETDAPKAPFLRHPVGHYASPAAPFATLTDFEDAQAYPHFTRIAIGYDTLPERVGSVWAAFPTHAQWNALMPAGRVRNQKGHEAAIAWREHGGEPFHYSVLSYDERGRVEALVRYTENIGFDAVYYEYNSANMVTSVRVMDYHRTFQTWYGHDDNGRVDSVWTDLSSVNAGLVSGPFTGSGWNYRPGLQRPQDAEIIYSYTRTGQVDTMRYPAIGVLVDYAYNHRKWLDTILATKNGAALWKQALTYDPSGQITAQRSEHAGAPATTQSYAYDRTQRLTGWAMPGMAELFGYDSAGNRLAARTQTAFGVDKATYTYGGIAGGPNRLAAITVTDTSGTITRSTSTHAYDRNGSTVMKRVVAANPAGSYRQEYAYSYRGLTRRFGTGDLTTMQQDWRYRYNAAGEREQKRLYWQTQPDSTVTYPWVYYLLGGSGEQLAVYHGQQTSGTQCGDTGRRVYMYPVEYLTYGLGHGANLITKPTGGRDYVLADHLGSARVKLDDSGLVVSRLDYRPFGEPVPVQGAVTGVRKSFIDKERDMESGAMNIGVRQLEESRFLSIDPLWEKYQGLSPYIYGANNPLRLVDRNGKEFTFYKADKVVDEGGNVDWVIQRDMNGNPIVDTKLQQQFEYAVAELEKAGVGQVEMLKYLKDSKDFVINLVSVDLPSQMKFYESETTNGPSYTLAWSSDRGLMYRPWKGASDNDVQFMSSALTLIHEASHPYRRFTNKEKYRADNSTPDSQYDWVEERNAINDEFAAGQKLGQLKYIRPSHNPRGIVVQYPPVCNPMQNTYCDGE